MAKGTKVYVSRIYKINGSSIAVYAFVKDEFGGLEPHERPDFKAWNGNIRD